MSGNDSADDTEPSKRTVKRADAIRNTVTQAGEKETERRGLLKGVGISVASTLGLSSAGGAAAQEKEDSGLTDAERETIKQQYQGRDAVVEVAKQYGKLLGDLKREGVIERPSADWLVPDEASPPEEFGSEGVAISAKAVDDEPVSVVKLVRQVGAGTLHVSFYPEVSDSMVVLDPGADVSLDFGRFNATRRVESVETEGESYQPYLLDEPITIQSHECDGCCYQYECSCYASTYCCSEPDQCPPNTYCHCCDCCCNNSYPCGFYNYPCECYCTSNGAFLDCC